MNPSVRVFRWLLLTALLVTLLPVYGRSSASVVDSVLVIAANTSTIPDEVFVDRTDFNRVKFEEPCILSSIGDYAFMGCRNLREIDLPKSLRKLGEGAFRECSALTAVSVPEGVMVIPKQAFAWCTSLRAVTLPHSVIDLASHSFAYCESLTTVNIPPKLRHVGSNAFCFCRSLASVSLPRSVTELESYAFAECSSLREAVLPANDKLLGELIFSGCDNLVQITVGSPVPPEFDCNSTLFDDTESEMYGKCQLIVPAQSVQRYRTAPGWCLFRLIEPIKK